MVSIVIPTKNSGRYLKNCLKSIRAQTYKTIEIILVDSGSTDDTLSLGAQYRCRILTFVPNIKKGLFEAPYKRNFGAKKAKGEYIYYVDADMELQKNVVKEAVSLCSSGFAGVIISEDSFGEGMWARAKNLERRCYWGDDTIEAPRFIKKSVWIKVGGLDENVGGGGDDWDLFQKLLEKGYTVGRTKSIVRHNEGRLTLFSLMRKRFMYGTQTALYVKKRPKAGFVSYFPIRMAYLRHWRLFLRRPMDTVAFVIMRTTEYSAGFLGILYGMLMK